jgi:hemerythrin superfamily protein
MNAIALLKADHRAVEELFHQLEVKSRGKKPLIEKLVHELSIHSAIEEEIFYPAVRKSVPGAQGQVLESLEEHNVVKWELSALASMNEGDERFGAKLKVLKDMVLHHVDEEEHELFPKVRQAMDGAKLNQLGESLERAKKTAPTRPHPRAPDEPPGNIVANMGASLVDHVRDAGRAILRGRNGKRTVKAERTTQRTTKRGGKSAAHRTVRA